MIRACKYAPTIISIHSFKLTILASIARMSLDTKSSLLNYVDRAHTTTTNQLRRRRRVFNFVRLLMLRIFSSSLSRLYQTGSSAFFSFFFYFINVAPIMHRIHNRRNQRRTNTRQQTVALTNDRLLPTTHKQSMRRHFIQNLHIHQFEFILCSNR